MSNVLGIAAIIMLLLLFLKVPVYIAVLGGAMVYFVANPGIKGFPWNSPALSQPLRQ